VQEVCGFDTFGGVKLLC